MRVECVLVKALILLNFDVGRKCLDDESKSNIVDDIEGSIGAVLLHHHIADIAALINAAGIERRVLTGGLA